MHDNTTRGKESSATTETYYLATGRYGSQRTLHADRECPAFDPDSTVRERTFSDPDPDALCGRCVEREEDWNQGKKDYDYQRALQEAAAENLITDGGTLTTCPECDSTRIRNRTPAKLGSPAHQTHNWVCLACGARFDDPVERDPKAATHAPSGLAKRLDDAESDALPDGGQSYCAACHRAVAREDRVEVAGEVYHRQCAPDEAAEHQQFDAFETDGGTPPATCTNCGAAFPPEGACPSDRGHNFVAFDGGQQELPTPTRREQERHARQAAHSLVAWSRRAGVDPAAVLDAVREGLPRGGDAR